MNINKIANIDNIKNIKPGAARKFLTNFGKDDVLLPIILLEATVTAGRAIQANKRSGFTEARERLFEDSFSAVFWLFGVKAFNSIGDFIGKHILKWPVTEFDVGKDPLRTPFENLSRDIDIKQTVGELTGTAKKVLDNHKAVSKEALAAFKFGKIIFSVIAATGLIGFLLPKINQSITRNVIQKSREKNGKKNEVAVPMGYTSIEDFKQKISSSKNPAFKSIVPSAEILTTIAHKLENDVVYKLLATDVGILTGRTLNARNKDERIEIAFRDIASSFFYYFSTRIIVGLMQKHTKWGGIAKLDPTSATHTYKRLAQHLAQQKDGQMSADAFRSAMIGHSRESGILMEMEKAFNKDVITLSKLKEYITVPKFIEKAEKMSRLQPRQRIKLESGEIQKISVLTRRQVQDILSDGILNDPKFLKDVYLQKFGEKLTNPYKFIAIKDINSFRQNIDDYVDIIAQYAQKHNGGIVDLNLLEKMNKMNLRKTASHLGVGFLVSALFLSTIIPKTQYLITKLRTGKNEFPGMEESDKNKKVKK